MMQIGEYAVEPTNEDELKGFLEFNNFQYNSDFENLNENSDPILVINIIKRFYFYIDKFFVYPRISEEEFYEKVNYYPNDVIYKKLFINYKNDCRKNHLQKSHCNMISIKPGRKRPIPHHVPHAYIHQNQQKKSGRNKTFYKKRSFFIFKQRIAFRFYCRSPGRI